tara:strand:- start:37126 stop:37308 length:183 start_codon:yes stop_codon:yes gene_type:complete
MACLFMDMALLNPYTCPYGIKNFLKPTILEAVPIAIGIEEFFSIKISEKLNEILEIYYKK